MELTGIDKHCSQPNCTKLDFQPIKCDACMKTFCCEHFSYNDHFCSDAYSRDSQAPLCPLCDKTILVGEGQVADVAVGKHIDRDCPSRSGVPQKCSLEGCGHNLEGDSSCCKDCSFNFCLKHQLPSNHKCPGKAAE